MKTLLLVVCLLVGFSSTSQEIDPDLYGTWYLYFIMDTDLGYPYNVSEITPSITPFITVSENLEAFGEGACNNFTTTYIHNGQNVLIASNFNSTNTECDFQVHNSFENAFFGFIMNEFWYEITPDDNGLTLNLGNPLMGTATFKNYPLSISKNEIATFKIYPNPVSETLFIASENNTIEEISVFSINGQVVLSKKENTNQLNVSSLSNGLYFVEVVSENGTNIQRFIKQ